MRRAVFILLLSGALAAPLGAVTVVPLSFEQVVDASRFIVYARVADVRGQWTADRRGIESLVRLEILEAIKGAPGARLTIKLPGGEAGGFINVLPGAPQVEAGDLVVLFLTADGASIPVPVGLTQGVYRVVAPARGGAPLVVPPPALSRHGDGRIVRGDPARRPASVAAFTADIRAYLEEAGR